MQCPVCREPVKPVWNLCPSCGQKLATVITPPPAATNKPETGGNGVRAQVFEVIVRHALKGAPWREICAAPMQINQISEQEVEEEVTRRRRGDHRPASTVPATLSPSAENSSDATLCPPGATKQLSLLRARLLKLAEDQATSGTNYKENINEMVEELDAIIDSIRALEQLARTSARAESEAQLQADLERENDRIRQQFRRGDEPGPHPITRM